ncbi:MAG: hypothetical protein ACPLTQ_08045, partial [Anaerolineae bacterium]
MKTVEEQSLTSGGKDSEGETKKNRPTCGWSRPRCARLLSRISLGAGGRRDASTHIIHPKDIVAARAVLAVHSGTGEADRL